MIILQIWTELVCARTLKLPSLEKIPLNMKTKQLQLGVILLIKSEVRKVQMVSLLLADTASSGRKTQRVHMRRTWSSRSSVCAWVTKDAAWEDVMCERAYDRAGV